MSAQSRLLSIPLLSRMLFTGVHEWIALRRSRRRVARASRTVHSRTHRRTQ